MSNAYLFSINADCIEQFADKNGEPYMVVGFPFYKSPTGFASISVKRENVTLCEFQGNSRKKRCNVLLGDENDSHYVRIPRSEQTETGDNYDRVYLKNAEIVAIRCQSSNNFIKRQNAISAVEKINNAIASRAYAETHPFDISYKPNISNTPSVSDTQNVSDTPNTQSVSSTIDLSNIVNSPVTIKTNVIVKTDNKIVIETIIDRL